MCSHGFPLIGNARPALLSATSILRRFLPERVYDKLIRVSSLSNRLVIAPEESISEVYSAVGFNV